MTAPRQPEFRGAQAIPEEHTLAADWQGEELCPCLARNFFCQAEALKVRFQLLFRRERAHGYRPAHFAADFFNRRWCTQRRDRDAATSLGRGEELEVAASLSLPLLPAPKAQGRVIGGHRPSVGTHQASPGQERPERSKAASRTLMTGEREPSEAQKIKYPRLALNSNAISVREVAFLATHLRWCRWPSEQAQRASAACGWTVGAHLLIGGA